MYSEQHFYLCVKVVTQSILSYNQFFHNCIEYNVIIAKMLFVFKYCFTRALHKFCKVLFILLKISILHREFFNA